MSIPPESDNPEQCFVERLESGLYASVHVSSYHIVLSYRTAISAKGNHYDSEHGEQFKPIDDKSKVKDVIVLRAPTMCSLDLQCFWDNQSAILQDIENTEIATDRAAGWNPSFRSCLRSTTTESPRKDIITIVTERKYGVPASAGAPRVAAPQTHKRLQGSGGTDQIKLGAFYDPRLLEDFGGPPYFRLVNGMLKQLDIRNAQNKLIAPWNNYIALRPGSLILAIVSIHMYTFKSEGNDRDRDRKFFQLNAHSIRVLDESDFPVEKRLPPRPTHNERWTGSWSFYSFRS
ncbi:hypothetical protein B0H13DRAFT_2318791 [Mycena leptocephala]|nr:hypothetical protein B0H13DRAFT_2318791 [Mycena leptocephala]